MNCSARLLAVITLSGAFVGCNAGAGESSDIEATASGAQAETSVATDAPADEGPKDAVSETGTTAAEPQVAFADEPAEDEGNASETERAASDEVASEPSSDAESRYTYNEDHDPNGIGKFYMGREIAQVMGHQGIAWLERPEREEEERLSLLIECLEIEEGSTVADIGAGSGVITTRLCEAVGEEGTVVAVDIQQEMLDALQLKCHELGYRNVELVLGTPETPQLVDETLDLVIMVDVYHEFDHPYEMLLDISRALKPGGRVVFVEYRKEDPLVPIKEVHKMSDEQVRLEAEQPEFQLEYVETIDELPRQHMVVFRRIDPTAAQ